MDDGPTVRGRRVMDGVHEVMHPDERDFGFAYDVFVETHGRRAASIEDNTEIIALAKASALIELLRRTNRELSTGNSSRGDAA